MTEPTSDTARIPFAPVIRTQTDLEAAWRHLMTPLGFRGCALWLMLIQSDDRPLPQLIEISECDGPPDQLGIDNLVAMLAAVPDGDPDHADDRDPGRRWAVLRSRPGLAEIDQEDRAWALMLQQSCARAGVQLEPLHVASDRDIRPVPLDELRRAS